MSGTSGRDRSSFEESETYIIWGRGFKEKNLKIFFSEFYKNARSCGHLSKEGLQLC